MDPSVAAEFVPNQKQASSEAERRARQLYEAGGDESMARALAVKEYKRALLEATELHVKEVLRLHDEVFSYRTNTLSISSLEGVSTFRLAKSETAVEGHGDTWASFQDRYITTQSPFSQARPRELLEERGAKRILRLEDEIDELQRKKHQGVFADRSVFCALEDQIAALQLEMNGLV